MKEEAVVDVVVWDDTDKLRWIWKLGSTIDKTPFSVGVADWEGVMLYVAEVHRITGKKVRLQVWGHGNDGRVFINNQHLPLGVFAARMRGIIVEFWARSCETIRGRRGQAWARSVTEALGCVYIGHKVVTNWPNPLWQGQIAALRPGQEVFWSPFGKDLKGCLTTRMRPPSHAYRD